MKDMKLDKKLGKLKMPMKKPGMDLSGLGDMPPDDDSMGPDADDSQQEGDDAGGDQDDAPGMDEGHDDQASDNKALEMASDDDLMAEMKKRGLLSKMGAGHDGQDPDTGDDQSSYS